MINNFYKLNKELKFTLDKVLQIENYNISISEKDFNRNNIEKLIEVGYLRHVADAHTQDGWSCFVLPTYDAEHYNELKKEHCRQTINEYVKYGIQLLVSIATLIMAIIGPIF